MDKTKKKNLWTGWLFMGWFRWQDTENKFWCQDKRNKRHTLTNIESATDQWPLLKHMWTRYLMCEGVCVSV